MKDSKFDSLNEIQNFITSESIYSELVLNKLYPELELRVKELGLEGSIIYSKTKKARSKYLKCFKTSDDFDQFFKNNNLFKPSEFKEFDERLYRIFNKTPYKDTYLWPRQFSNWKIPDDFQKIIDKSNWESPSDMYKDDYGKYLYGYLNRLGKVSSLIFKSRMHKYTQEEALGLIEKSCNLHGLVFRNKSTFRYLGSLENNIELYCPVHNHSWVTSFNSFVGSDHSCKICGVTRSKLEEEIHEFLNKNFKEEDIEEQVKFEGLIYKNNLSIDFYIKSLKIAIECQGEFHFETTALSNDTNFKNQVIRDKIKYNYCKNKGIHLLYYSNPKIFKENHCHNYNEMMFSLDNYFDTIYTDIDSLLQRINEIRNEIGGD